jgi:hypothetical protein
VFHLEAIALHEKKKSGSQLLLKGLMTEPASLAPVSLPPETFHAARAVRQAVRAVYALGLDLALVRIGIMPTGRTLIVDVNPAPRLSPASTRLLAQAIERYCSSWAHEKARRQPAVLGADPEFALYDLAGSRFVPASRFLEREGRVGCDAVVVRGGQKLLPLAELRPEPSCDPFRLVQSLREAMLEAEERIGGDIAWLAGGRPAKGLPLGGHIHFSNVWLSSRLLRALDNYTALPLVMLESDSSRHRRPRYGGLGDFRRKSHGGFEFRALSSWLATPGRAEGVLCLARIVVDHYSELQRTPLRQPEVQRLFYEGDVRRLKPIVEALWSDLERTWSWHAYRKPLEALKRDTLEGNIWEEAEDIRPYWKIESRPRKQPAPAGFVL